MKRIYNNEGDEIGGDSGGKQPIHVETATARCSHTMKIKQSDGSIVCGDCGYIIQKVK